ncbi:hypothetical protein [Bradyrhizobium sp. 2S1]|uniref:hypothetical protein n=1 Tax=Bradyrhizobium sp. 2S1 TaxID=1404429 RepID=UPI00140CDA0A|nr:hypothetical protein [Bradyrhizobium sp. 2S1]MCK7669101.1 hypothetical protein [Bradyrhizobium sp. 2S1]MCK7671503.1 hypothetical protein [Bradyrhizobium sp. 2S1]
MARDEELIAAYEEIDRLRGGFLELLEAATGKFDPLGFVERVTGVTAEMLDEALDA